MAKVRITALSFDVEDASEPWDKGQGDFTWHVTANGETVTKQSSVVKLGDGDSHEFNDEWQDVDIDGDVLKVNVSVREHDDSDPDDTGSGSKSFYGPLFGAGTRYIRCRRNDLDVSFRFRLKVVG